MIPPAPPPDDLSDIFNQDERDQTGTDDIFSTLDSLMGDEPAKDSKLTKKTGTHEFKDDLPDWMLHPDSTSSLSSPEIIKDEDLEAFLGDLTGTPREALSSEQGEDYGISSEFSGWLEGKEIDDKAGIDTLLSFVNDPAETIDLPAADLSKDSTDDLFSNLEDLELELPDWLKDANLGGTENIPFPVKAKDDFAILDEIFQQGKDSESQPPHPKDRPDLEEGTLASLKKSISSEEIRDEPLGKDDLADLRFDSLLSARRETNDQTERVGALKDMAGVLKPELLFEGNSLSVDAMIEEFIVTPIQARSIEILRAAFSHERRYRKVNQANTSVILRLITAVLMITVILLPTVFKINILSEATVSPMFQVTYQFVEDLSPGSRLLFIFDYGPEASAEISPLAETVMSHALDSGASIYILSTNPLSTTIVEQLRQEQVLDSRISSDGQWIDFGYLPGGVNGISSIIAGGASTILSPLYTDHIGNPTNLNALSLKELDLAGVFIISSQFDNARLWIEQLRLYEELPLFAVSSTAASPVLRNYAYSGQIRGMVSGIPDSAAYQTLRNGGPDRNTLIQWNAQALGGVTAAAIIIIFTIILSFTGRKGKTS